MEFLDLYFYIRALLHAKDSYLGNVRGELVRLSEVEALFFQLNGYLVELRKDNLDELVGEIQRCVAETLATLTPKVIIQEKVEARDKVLHIYDIYDSLKRVNSTQLLSRLVAARRRVFVRHEQVRDIVDDYTVRLQVALLATSFLEAQVRIADDFLTRLLGNWGRNVKAHPEFFAKLLRQNVVLYRAFTVNPFLATFSYVADEYERAAEALERQDFPVANALLRTAHASFQLRALRTDLEQTVFSVSRDLHEQQDPNVPVTLQAIEKSVQRLQAIDCSGMRDFSVPSTLSGLHMASAFFQQTAGKAKAYKQGYAALRQTATAI